MRSLRRALLGALAAGFWIGCSVNHSGLTDDGGLSGDGATGAGGGAGAAGAGRGGSTGAGGAAGSIISGAGGGAGNGGGPGSGGTAGSATGGTGGGGTGGGAGSVVSGNGGSGGDAAGCAGTTGTAGASGSGSAGSGGDAGTGAGGDVSGGGGGAGTVGAAGQGGAAGAGGGAGGRGGFGFGGRGGATGRGGTGGTGGNPCAAYPSAKAFTPPNETRVHCYWTRSSSQTWSEAQQACMLQNGHLVTILSAEENDFVVSIAQFSTTYSDTWIGATDGKAGGDRTGPGTYRWVTNEAWAYSNWQSGQPDGFCDPCSAGQTCTCDHRGVLSSDGTWNDRWQDNGRSSVCEAP